MTATNKPQWPAVSIRQIGEYLDVDRDAIRKAISNCDLQPVAKGARGHATYDAGEMVRALLARRGDVDPATLSPADRRNLAVARRQELELEIRSSAYLPRDSIRQGTATAFATVAQSLRSIPDLVERKTGATPDTCELIEQVIDSVCNDLAERLEALHREATAE